MKRHLRNILAMIAGDAGSRVIGFLVTVYLARVLAPAAFGMITLGLAVLGHLSLAASPGIQILEVRNVAASHGSSGQRAGAILTLRLALSGCLFFLAWIVCSLFLGPGATRDVIVLYTLSLVPLALMLDWFFQGKEDFPVLSASRIANYLAFAAATILLVRSAGDVRLTPVAFFTGNAVAAGLLLIVYYRRNGPLAVSGSARLWRSILKENLPVGAAAFLAQVVVNFPPLVVGFFRSEAEVGIFSAAMKVAFVVLILDRLFYAVFLPLSSRYLSARREDAAFLLTVTLKSLLYLLPAAAICVLVLAPAAVAMIFGSGYEGAVGVLRILTTYIVLTVLNTVFVCALLSAGRERRYSRAMALGTGALAVVVVAMTAVFGAPGAAAGVVLGEGLTMLLMFLEARKVVPLPPATVLIRPAFAVTAIGILWFLLPGLSAGVMLVLFLAVIILAGPVTGAFEKEEIRFLRERLV